jgi:hypothetical protein
MSITGFIQCPVCEEVQLRALLTSNLWGRLLQSGRRQEAAIKASTS